MAYTFQNLPQTVDKRGKLTEHSRHGAPKRQTSLRNMERAIHHSATMKDASGSTPEGFSNYHVNTLDWPCIGYAIVITPNQIVDTPNGKRARIHFNVNLEYVTYHVGNSNDVAMGICIAGNYSDEYLDDPTMASYYELMEALDTDKIAMGGQFKHSQYPGYSWKACSVFEPEYAYKNGKESAGGTQNQTPIGDTPAIHTVQQGDTLYSIAQGDDRISVDDLIAWNNVDPSNLKIGQPLRMKAGAKLTTEHSDGWKTDGNGYEYREESAVFTNTSGGNIVARVGYPSTNATFSHRMAHGDTYTYDRVYTSDGYVWISKVYDGVRSYLPVRTHVNGEDGESWGDFS